MPSKTKHAPMARFSHRVIFPLSLSRAVAAPAKYTRIKLIVIAVTFNVTPRISNCVV